MVRVGYVLLMLGLSVLGLIWIIKEMRSFEREEQQHKHRQEEIIGVIRLGLKEAKGKGINVIDIDGNKVSR